MLRYRIDRSAFGFLGELRLELGVSRMHEGKDPLRFRDEIHPHGARKVLALLFLAAVTTVPPVIAWRTGPEPAPSASFPRGRFAPRGGFLPEQESTASKALKLLGSLLYHAGIIFCTTLGLMVYYPRAGFKRFALLGGPLIALAVPLALSFYLSGRTEVLRVELGLVSLVAALPGAALYLYLMKRKAERLGIPW